MITLIVLTAIYKGYKKLKEGKQSKAVEAKTALYCFLLVIFTRHIMKELGRRD